VDPGCHGGWRSTWRSGSYYNAERAGSVTGLTQQETETAGRFLTVTMVPKRASACYLRSSTELNPSPLHQQFHRHLDDKGRLLAFAQWDVG
jgi:hypothetical protein